jgi:hypothetical protein
VYLAFGAINASLSEFNEENIGGQGRRAVDRRLLGLTTRSEGVYQR